jgi:hypothetical protein
LPVVSVVPDTVNTPEPLLSRIEIEASPWFTTARSLRPLALKTPVAM